MILTICARAKKLFRRNDLRFLDTIWVSESFFRVTIFDNPFTLKIYPKKYNNRVKLARTLLKLYSFKSAISSSV